MLVLGVDKSLVNKEIRVVSSTIEDLTLFSGFHIFQSEALTHTVLNIKKGSHVTLGVVGKVPERDEGKGHARGHPKGDLVLTRHDARHRPHKVVEVEANFVEGKGWITMGLKFSKNQQILNSSNTVNSQYTHTASIYLRVAYSDKLV